MFLDAAVYQRWWSHICQVADSAGRHDQGRKKKKFLGFLVFRFYGFLGFKGSWVLA